MGASAHLLQSLFLHMAARVSLFVTCIVDQLFPKAGMAVVDVLERLGFPVDFPEQQTCCGQPVIAKKRGKSRGIFSVFFAAPITSWCRRARARQ